MKQCCKVFGYTRRSGAGDPPAFVSLGDSPNLRASGGAPSKTTTGEVARPTTSTTAISTVPFNRATEKET